MNKLIVYIKRFTVCCGLLFIFLLNSYAQRDTIGDKCSQSMVLYFRFDRAIVDKGYMGNSETLHHLDEVLSDSALSILSVSCLFLHRKVTGAITNA